ncbi:LysR family transcriptional regulator [Marinobacter sp. JSM 1782161]|uniref:LysR family transcriptional regulator n=1 Tax=Marinobacter sp. JSM 1782161 TaxID=2685906 RepID=UPI00140317C9|nr:LysR family transcriptional regulator [Marinobacter sp. JSM 1782161]
MAQEGYSDLLAFIAVARQRSFTRAAAQLGLSQSALSHRVRGLEERLGLRLLTRTTRSVSPTDAGERLLQKVAPKFEEIEEDLANLEEFRDTPAGKVRITATDHAARNVLWPKLSKVLHEYPDLEVEITIDYGLADIVAERYDMGVRLGGQVAKDMIAVRIAPDLRMAIVGAPEYLDGKPPPRTPEDLTSHNCINLRLPTKGGLMAWKLRQGDRELSVRVSGQLTFNNSYQMLDAALEGYGLAYLPDDVVGPYVTEGRLQYVLEDWFPTHPGLHVFYPHRKQSSPALAVLVDALRYDA